MPGRSPKAWWKVPSPTGWRAAPRCSSAPARWHNPTRTRPAARTRGGLNRILGELQLQYDAGERTQVWLKYAQAQWDEPFRSTNFVDPYATADVFPAKATVPNAAFGYAVPNPGERDPFRINTNTPSTDTLDHDHTVVVNARTGFGDTDVKYVGGYSTDFYTAISDLDYTSRNLVETSAGSNPRRLHLQPDLRVQIRRRQAELEQRGHILQPRARAAELHRRPVPVSRELLPANHRLRRGCRHRRPQPRPAAPGEPGHRCGCRGQPGPGLLRRHRHPGDAILRGVRPGGLRDRTAPEAHRRLALLQRRQDGLGDVPPALLEPHRARGCVRRRLRPLHAGAGHNHHRLRRRPRLGRRRAAADGRMERRVRPAGAGLRDAGRHAVLRKLQPRPEIRRLQPRLLLADADRGGRKTSTPSKSGSRASRSPRSPSMRPASPTSTATPRCRYT